MDFWPYIPSRQEWKEVPWEDARAIDPRVDNFIGHDKKFFYFQVRGVNKEIKVEKAHPISS